MVKDATFVDNLARRLLTALESTSSEIISSMAQPHLLICLLSAFTLIFQFTSASDIKVPETIAADLPVQATIDMQVLLGATGYCNGFRVYLASSYTDKDAEGYRPACTPSYAKLTSPC